MGETTLDEYSCGAHTFTVAHVKDQDRKSTIPCAFCGKDAYFVKVRT